jgi:uncharacterized repeat protein (TIGR01451 family)
VTDLLPAGLTLVSAIPSLGTYNAVTGLWDVGTVSPGGSQTLIINARVDSPNALTNIGSISLADQFDPSPGNNTASVTETPQQADLVVAKTVSNPTPNVGDTITFTVTLTDVGPDAATGVQVTDLLPAGLTLVSAIPSLGTYNAVTGLWDVGTVSPGGSQTLIHQCQGGQPQRADKYREHQPRRPVRPEPGQQHRQRHRDAPVGRAGSISIADIPALGLRS